ncbi:hypothetical protein SAMN05216357_1102 [Porphyromonadaceae bacterium KH3CP3RA]|nr:hypothetical protein SAMN05216357_1102 [Porphyromonadaceae bacterium KH3CP3RA]
MNSEFEENEYRGPLFNQLEKGSNLIWEPGQVFEKQIGIDRASHCLNSYLWNLHGYCWPLAGVILRYRIPLSQKLLPDFSLNLFVQAKRSIYSSRSNRNLKPYINGRYWYFEVTSHQQKVLEDLNTILNGNALVIYSAPVFHKQQELYINTVGGTIVENSTFPSVSSLKGHKKWYFDTPGIIGIANPSFDYIEESGGLIMKMKNMREIKGDFISNDMIENVQKISKGIRTIIESNNNTFEATQFAYQREIIEMYLNEFDITNIHGIRDIMEIEAFCYLWKLQWKVF